MKIAIVYYSRHHANTRKLIDAIAKAHHVTLIDAVDQPDADLSRYEMVGFASGIYYSKFHKSVLTLAKALPAGMPVFFLYTCGAKKDGYTRAIRETAEGRSAKVLGEYGCLGFDSFGPFKLIGGMAKGHPTADEIQGAVHFVDGLLG